MAKASDQRTGTRPWTIASMILCVSIPAIALELPGDIDRVEASVVRVVTDRSTGSGFIVSASGHIVTNWHVVEGSKELYVLESGSDELQAASVLWQEEALDAAIIRYDSDQATRALVLRMNPPAKGTAVYSLGYPGAADLGIEAGAVNYKGRALGKEASLRDGVVGRVMTGNWGKSGGGQFPVIQHNAEISGGNSGGPLLDRCGAVLGINTAGRNAELVKDRQGKLTGGVDVNPGIYLAAHVGIVRSELERLDISFTGSNEECVLAAGNDRFVYIGLMSAMLAFSGVLAFRKPRERVVRMVADSASVVNESVSRLVGKPTSLSKTTLELRSDSAGAPAFSLGASRFKDPKWGLSFGRHPALADYTIDSGSISKRHFRIAHTGSRYYVEDLNSTSGTTLNGRQLQPFELQRLRTEDRLGAGDVSWTVRI